MFTRTENRETKDVRHERKNLLRLTSNFLLLTLTLALTLSSALVFSKEAKTIITEDWIRDAITHYVEEQIPWAEDHIRVDLIGPRERIFLSDEKTEYNIILLDNRGPLGRRAFQIEFRQDGVVHRMLKAIADVRMEMDVVAVSHPLKRHEIISKDDLYMKKITFYDVSGNLLFDPETAIGKRAKRFIRPGTLLTEEMIEEAPLIKKGERVIIIVEGKGIMITAAGEARMDGAKGKIIEVINSDSKKRIFAEVLDSGKVKVTY